MTQLKSCSLVSSSEALLCKQRLIRLITPGTLDTNQNARSGFNLMLNIWQNFNWFGGHEMQDTLQPFFSFCVFGRLNTNIYNPLSCGLYFRHTVRTFPLYSLWYVHFVQPLALVHSSSHAWISSKRIVASEIKDFFSVFY